MSKEYSFACHDDKMCFLPHCTYLIILTGDIKHLLQKLDGFCFNYQQVDCPYTLFKYRFSCQLDVKSGQIFDHVQRAGQSNHQTRGLDGKASILKKRLLRKKKFSLSSFQKTKSTHTSRSVFANRIEQVKRTEFELELIKSCRLISRWTW